MGGPGSGNTNLTRAPKVTPELQEQFFEALAELGNMSKAAEAVEVSSSTMFNYKRDNLEFKSRCREAMLMYAESVLLAEVDRRAVEGVNKPVFYQGWKCGHIREFSDSLLMFRVKGLLTEYATERREVTGANGGPLEVNGRHLTDEQLDARINELASQARIDLTIGRKSLPAETKKD